MPFMRPKRIRNYIIHTDSLNLMEHGQYMYKERHNLKIGDYVILKVYPSFPDDVIKEATWSNDNPPEYLILAKVWRFTEDRLGVFFEPVMEEIPDE